MKGGNVVIYSKNYVTDKPESELKFIVFKYTSKGNTIRIQI